MYQNFSIKQLKFLTRTSAADLYTVNNKKNKENIFANFIITARMKHLISNLIFHVLK